jgi:dodecin
MWSSEVAIFADHRTLLPNRSPFVLRKPSADVVTGRAGHQLRFVPVSLTGCELGVQCKRKFDFKSAIPPREQLARFAKRSETLNRGNLMAVARVTTITASSSKGFKEAVDEGMNRAAKTLRGITGFEVRSLKGKVEKGKVVEYRVTMEVTFILD